MIATKGKQISKLHLVPEKQSTPKIVSALFIVALMISLFSLGFTTYAFASPSPTSSLYMEEGVYPGAPTYTVWREDSTYYAKDVNGHIDTWGTSGNASQIINDACSNAGNNSIVLITSGNYAISGRISITYQYNFTLMGQGKGTRLYASTSMNYMLLFETTERITIRDMTFEGRQTANRGVGTTAGSNYYTISSCWFARFEQWCIYHGWGSGGVIENCYFQPANGGGIYQDGGSATRYVHNSFSYGTIGIEVYASSPYIDHNNFYHTSSYGIYVTAGSGGTITGNGVGEAQTNGMRLENDRMTVTGNIVYKSQHHGILFKGDHSTICGNIVGESDEVDSGYVGIRLENAYNNTVVGNNAWDVAGSATQDWGIGEVTSDWNIFGDNFCQGTVAGLGVSGANSIHSNNINQTVT